MKFMILVLVLLALLAVPVLGMTEKEAGYIAGVENGYELGYLAHSGLGNATAAQMFNDLATKYNSYLDGIGGQKFKLAALPAPDTSYMPAFLRDYQGTNPWAGVPGPSTTNTTPNGIVHAIDGGVTKGTQYTTNDINTLPAGAIEAYHKQDSTIDPKTGVAPNMGDGYLGGV